MSIPSAPQREPERSKNAKRKIMNSTIFDSFNKKDEKPKNSDNQNDKQTKKKKKEKRPSIFREGVFNSDTYYESRKPGY